MGPGIGGFEIKPVTHALLRQAYFGPLATLRQARTVAMPRLIHAVLACILALGSSHAQETSKDWDAIMAEAAWDWRPGDLIFLNGINDFDELIRQPEGGKWGSVGIMRPSSGDPRVVFASEGSGVTELILYEVTDVRTEAEYAVYRIKDAVPQGLGLLTNYSLFSAYGKPFDHLMLFGNGSFYNAELPFEAAMSEGYTIAKPRKLADLADLESPLAEAILTDWRGHPYCVAALSEADCWEELKNIAVVTPGALLASGALEQVYP